MNRILLLSALVFIISGCRDNKDSGDYYMSVPYRTLEAIKHRLEDLQSLKVRETSDRVMIEQEIRSEINEFKICEEVLKELKDMKESMTKEAWSICRGRAIPFETIRNINGN